MKRTRFGLIGFAAAFMVSLASCAPSSSSTGPVNSNELRFTIISPQGAPAASLARYGMSEKLTLAQAQQVRAAFTSAESDFIIFDSVNGLKLAGDNYRLARMVTFGNLYVISTGNDDDGVMDDEDNIFSYGEGLVPDMVFKKVYPEIIPDNYGAQVSDTSPVLLSGTFEGQEIDYVVSSYPPIFAAMNNANKKTDLSVYSNVAEEFGEKYDTDGFPQAGLFIKKSLEENDTLKADLTSFLNQFDKDIEDLVNGASEAVKLLGEYGSVEEQADRFGFNANVLKGVQKTNALAFLTADKNPSLAGYDVFKSEFGFPITEDLLSSYYPDIA